MKVTSRSCDEQKYIVRFLQTARILCNCIAALSRDAGGGVDSHQDSAQSYKDKMEFRPEALNHNCLPVISSEDLCKFWLDQKNLNLRYPCEGNMQLQLDANSSLYTDLLIQNSYRIRLTVENTSCEWAFKFRANTVVHWDKTIDTGDGLPPRAVCFFKRCWINWIKRASRQSTSLSGHHQAFSTAPTNLFLYRGQTKLKKKKKPQVVCATLWGLFAYRCFFGFVCG